MQRLINRGLLAAGLAAALGAGLFATSASAATLNGGSSWPASRGGSFWNAGPCNRGLNYLHGGRPDGLRAVGLTDDQELIAFFVNRPDRECTIGTVDLPGDEQLVGIDYRVQDGNLYGLGGNGGIFTLSTSNANATKVSQLTVALQGTSFDIDFNPAADRLRIISDQGQNLRHDVNTGGTTVVDGSLTYPPSTMVALGVTGAAYTNNDLDASSATTLFDIDTNLDQVAVQSPANSGQLAPTGQLGVNADLRAGFDIYSSVRSGRAVDNRGFAVLNGMGRSVLYAINLLTGVADRIGAFDTDETVIDLAIPLNQ